MKIKNLILLGTTLLLILYIGFAIIQYRVFNGVENAGVFGDMFGSVNALFSGFALLGVILTIYLQSKELKYQREELQLTRKEIKGQKQEMKQQNQTLNMQQFENSFFNLLSTYNSIVNDMEIRATNKSAILAVGRNCFAEYSERLQQCFENRTTIEDHLKQISLTFEHFFKFYQNHTEHYFNNLYHFLKYIENSSIYGKQYYANIIKAQLSSNELVLIFYYGLSDYGHDEFKLLIEKYSLLQNLDNNFLLKESHKKLYLNSAYEENKDSKIRFKNTSSLSAI